MAKTTKVTEGDVEFQVIEPLFCDADMLAFPKDAVRSKQYLAAKTIGKGATQRTGYIPDFCIYSKSLPVLVIEAKRPDQNAEAAYGEAALYCHELNKAFPTGVNPCTCVFSTNGTVFFAGYWDTPPLLSGPHADLVSGSKLLAELRDLLGPKSVDEVAEKASFVIRGQRFQRAGSLGSGPALLNSKVEPNTFAADLAPTLRRYFTSRDQNDDPEIYDRAYISSDEVTSYDRILESFLKDRAARLLSATDIQTTKKEASEVSGKLRQLSRKRASGELQLITGGVGSGKSLFARRYKELLQPSDLAKKTHWAFIDFNEAVELTERSEEWVCRRFVESLLREGSTLNLRNEQDQERVFATDLADRQSYYDRLERNSAGRGELERARDLEAWRQDPLRAAKGCARYLQGDRSETIIAVFDNVDRRESHEQLIAFQLALWFMSETRSLILLQMRDATFEAYKSVPPLDTYRTGQIFHVTAPRFVNVVRRRLELSLSAFEEIKSGTVNYRTSNGITVTYPKERAGTYLKHIYDEVFIKPKNISTVLEALAGKDVRKSLDMFMAIITSGHMPEDMIHAITQGSGGGTIAEWTLIRVLMRQDYRFFTDGSGFISNIFWCEPSWKRPSNFLTPEILYTLIGKRKDKGENGLTGFVSHAGLIHKLEHMGFIPEDANSALSHLLKAGLIESDNFSSTGITEAISFRATASGWAHMRILSSRIEYIYSVLATTPIGDMDVVSQIASALGDEARLGRLSIARQKIVIQDFVDYLREEYRRHLAHPGFEKRSMTGASYVIEKIESALGFAGTSNSNGQLDLLDQ